MALTRKLHTRAVEAWTC